MPTVIALDVSLSMLRPVPALEATETPTRLSLAIVAVNTFLDYLQAQMKLEYVSLVTFSSTCEVAVPFTREFDSIRQKLSSVEEGDRTCYQTALSVIHQHVLNEWGHQTPVQIVFVTDGTAGVGPIGRARVSSGLPLPPNYPARIHFLPIAVPSDTNLQHAMPLYQSIVDQASSCPGSPLMLPRGVIYCPDHLTVAGVTSSVHRLTEQQYAPAMSLLKCGQLECRVQLCPPPAPVQHAASAPKIINVIGFISTQDLGTPITLSRHLIIPQAQGIAPATRDNIENKIKDSTTTTDGDDDMSEPSKVPNFCVLLHGALKVESMAAIVQLGPSWWGVVSAGGADSGGGRRRSGLILGALRPFPPAGSGQIPLPGSGPAPWLGAMCQLGPEEETATCDADTFPIKCVRSYSGGGSGAAWSRTHALLADVQKVLRHARKLPDKTSHLYKELNRLRRMAISLGFTELLTHVAAILERECALASGIGASEAAIQLAHASTCLRDPVTQSDIQHNLTPHSMADQQ